MTVEQEIARASWGATATTAAILETTAYTADNDTGDNKNITGDNKNITANNTTEASMLDAYGCTFILAPAWSLRLGTEDNVLMSASVQSDMALLLQSELQPRCAYQEWRFDVAPSLCADARRVYEEENAGGSSLISEAMSMELLARAFGAKLLKTEMQLAYFPSTSAITDFAVELDGIELGVSVTRAMSHPDSPLTLEAALRLLQKKLSGVLKSTAACYNASWRKQVLHIWARSAQAARLLEEAYALLAPELIHSTLVLVTRCNALPEIFTEKATARPPQAPKPPKGLKDEAHRRHLRESDPTRKKAAF